MMVKLAVSQAHYSTSGWMPRLGLLALPLIWGLLGLVVACSEEPQVQSRVTAPLKLLKVEPAKGYVREPFTITGEGLPPGGTIHFEWGTQDGTYVAEASPENVRLLGRRFVEKRGTLGAAVPDAQGRVTVTFAAPEDYGGMHDIYAIVDGQEVARGDFQTLSSATLSPADGPIGTPITLTVKGMGWKPAENTAALLYDNKYMGFATAVTTRGSAVIRFRAAGHEGLHTIQLTGAGPGITDVNLQRKPASQTAIEFNGTFTITKDAGVPPNTLDWAAGSRVATLGDAIPKITVGGTPVAQGSSAGLEPPYGRILSQTALWAKGLPPNSELELFWVTFWGNLANRTGRSVTEIPLRKAVTSGDGSLRAAIQVPPDALGGWHVVKAVQGGNVLIIQAPYFVQRSLVDVSPQRVRVGQTFTVRINGMGRFDLDSAVAVTYDNAYIGYASTSDSNGDIDLNLVATGGPGTHLIDLYPMVYRAKGDPPSEDFAFQFPFLTALQDYPGQALGYDLPIFRLAVGVVP